MTTMNNKSANIIGDELLLNFGAKICVCNQTVTSEIRQ